MEKTTALARKQGMMDGIVDALLKPFDCDARVAFIRRMDLEESEWDAYRDAYNDSFDKGVRRK